MADTLARLYAVGREVWNEGFLGGSIGDLVTALLILLLFLALRGLFARWVIGLSRRALIRRRQMLAVHVVEALGEPLKLLPVIVGLFLALDHLNISADAMLMADRVIRSLLVFAVFWALYRMVTPAAHLFRRLEEVLTPELLDWMMKVLKGIIVVMGGATLLENWGVNVVAVLAGFGLVGAAVALGAQDLFKNLIGGLLIMAEKRFARGDWINVDGVVEGTVESIGIRSTRVRRFDKAPVHVPNNFLSDRALVNFSMMTYRRINWVIGVTYSTSVPQLRQIRDEIEAHVLTDEAFVRPDQASTFVRIDKFGDSSIDIMLYCFTVTTNWGEWLAVKEKLAYRIMQIVLDNGSSFAFPSQSVYLEAWPTGDRPELFVPPVPGSGPPPAGPGGTEETEGKGKPR